MRRLWLIAFALLGILLVGGGIAAASLQTLLHAERTVRPDVPGAAVVQIQAADSISLKASWFPPPIASTRCVMFLHGVGGWRERASRFTPLFRKEGYGLLAPDSRAHGESGGEQVTFGLLEKYDTIAWTKWMRSHGCEKIYGLG